MLIKSFIPHLLIAINLCWSTYQEAQAQESKLEVHNGSLKVRLPNGDYKTGKQLVGGYFTVGDKNQFRIKIKSARIDPKDIFKEIVLYKMALVTKSGKERNICSPDPHGNTSAIIIAGRSHPDGTLSLTPEDSFEIACTAGFQAKCIRAGYAPWRKTKDGKSMLDWFNSCVRMFRADYCGDGRHFTRNGTLIEFYDHIGINNPTGDPNFKFEASWGPAGATCVEKTRIPSIITLDGLEKTCPKLKGKEGYKTCSKRSGALLFNHSK